MAAVAIAPAPEIFQNRLEAALSRLNGVKTIVDDLVFGKAQYWRRLQKCMMHDFLHGYRDVEKKE